jgi:hypothetical protein
MDSTTKLSGLQSDVIVAEEGVIVIVSIVKVASLFDSLFVFTNQSYEQNQIF